MPIISSIVTIPIDFKILTGTFLIISFYMHAPADTYKRPIISKKRRIFFKVTSTIIVSIYIIISITINNNLISNILFLASLTQAFIISPYIYQLFNLPFDNYKNYISE